MAVAPLSMRACNAFQYLNPCCKCTSHSNPHISQNNMCSTIRQTEEGIRAKIIKNNLINFSQARSNKRLDRKVYHWSNAVLKLFGDID